MTSVEINGAWLTVTRRCNNRCAWCYAKGKWYDYLDMPLELCDKLINLLSDIGVKSVVIIGGEPTLYENLDKVIDNVINNKMIPHLVTNGRRFSGFDFAKKIANTGIDHILFSAKACNREQYLELTQADGFDEMIEGYFNLKKLGIDVSFSIAIISGLINSLEEMIKNLFDIGVKDFLFDLGSPVVIGNHISTHGIPEIFELSKACVATHNILSNTSVYYSYNMTIPLCALPTSIKNQFISKKLINTCCHVQSGSGVVFDTKGEILVCNQFADHSTGKYGVDIKNVHEFRLFWNSRMENVRKICRRYPSDQCINCKEWDICGGMHSEVVSFESRRSNSTKKELKMDKNKSFESFIKEKYLGTDKIALIANGLQANYEPVKSDGQSISTERRHYKCKPSICTICKGCDK